MADAFSYATLYEDELSITRLLRDRSASNKINASSPGMIAWYCFIVSMVLPTFLCVFYCWCTRYRSHRRAQTTLDRELQHENDSVISRMEANIQAFSKVEKNRRTESMRAAIRLHVMRVSEQDLLAAQAREKANYGDNEADKGENSTDPSEDDSSSFESKLCSNSCNVCLETFQVGDVVAHSSHSACTHVFHEDCIISWLVTTENPLCPCCRQIFVKNTRTPQTSITSQEQFSSAFGEGESTPGDVLSVAGDIDRTEEGMIPTVVSEDPELARRDSLIDKAEAENIDSEDPEASSIRLESTDEDEAEVEDPGASSRRDSIDEDEPETTTQENDES